MLSRRLTLANAAVLIGAPLVFLAQLPHLPAQIPVHYGLHGPDRWNTPHELWLIGALMLLLTAMFALFGWIAANHTPAQPDHDRARWRALVDERRTRTVRLMETIALAQNAGLAAVWLILGTGRTDLVPLAVAAALLLSLGGMVAALIGHGSRLTEIGHELLAFGHAAALGTSPSGYRWGGLIYYAPGDRAVFVPKRSGIGLTVNFARPGAWIFVLVTAVLPLAVVAAIQLAVR